MPTTCAVAEFGGGVDSSKAAARPAHSKISCGFGGGGYYLLGWALLGMGIVLVFFPVPPFTRQAAGL